MGQSRAEWYQGQAEGLGQHLVYELYYAKGAQSSLDIRAYEVARLAGHFGLLALGDYWLAQQAMPGICICSGGDWL